MVTSYFDREYNDVQSKTKQEDEHNENWTIPVQTSWKCVVLPFSASSVIITTSVAGIGILNPHSKTARNGTAFTIKASWKKNQNKPVSSRSGISPPMNPHLEKNVCSNRISNSGQPYAVPIRLHIKKSQKSRCKNGIVMKDSEIVNVQPTDTVSMMYKLEIEKSRG